MQIEASTTQLNRHPAPSTAKHGAGGTQSPWGRVHTERNGFLYAGPIFDTATQRSSVVVCVALTDNEFSVQTKEHTLPAVGAALVPPGYMKINSGMPPVALLDVCPTDYNFRALARVATEPQVWPRAHFAPIFDAMEAYKSGQMHRADVGGLFSQFLALALQLVPPAKPLDPRIRDVMRLLREDPGQPIGEVAAAVSMSVDWLRHLFVTEVGIPLRKYEMTLRMQTAAAHLQRGVSLTQVAANAGFADLAHFSKFWKLHYGYAPRRAFAGSELAIDAIPWPCLEKPPSAETPVGPTR